VNSNQQLRRTLGRLGVTASIATFALIVLGGIVRITGSGLGCGDDWPLCNGQLFPPLDLPTLIEYGHRLAALLVSAFVGAVALVAWMVWRRGSDTATGTGAGSRLLRLAVLAVVVLVVQILLGAVTVWLELPPAAVIVHLGTAMLLLATLIVLTSETYGSGRRRSEDRAVRIAFWTAVATLAVVLLGALTANLDAGHACQGFPLCNGAIVPASGGNPLVLSHWAHRMAAYGLVAWFLVLPFVITRSRPSDPGLRRPARIAAITAFLQLAVGAAMVLMNLPGELRAVHVGLGAALFVAAVSLAWEARYPALGQPTDSSSAT
jgi:heme A synthase